MENNWKIIVENSPQATKKIAVLVNRVQKKSRLHGCEPEEGFLDLCQFLGRPSNFRKKSHVRKISLHAIEAI